MLERTLIDLLLEHNTTDYRGNNGWRPEAWTKIAKEFQERERYSGLTKAQIQDKEKELKRDYNLLKEARKQSGASWDERRGMILAEPAVWNNIIHSYPKAKKFRNKSFSYFEALGELNDGQTAEGTYNFTSTQQNIPDLTQVGTTEENSNTDDLEGNLGEHEQADADGRVHEREEEDESSERRDQRPQRRDVAVSRDGQEKQPKRQKKNSNLEVLVERYLDIKSKQVEDEAAQTAREREARQGNDFSIKKCISVLSSMEVTRLEKVKVYNVFKDPDNRQIFLSACDDDPESALVWLRNEMA